MLGIDDFWIYIAYLLTVVVVIICVIYGIVNWNKGDKESAEELASDLAWLEHETEINDEFIEKL